MLIIRLIKSAIAALLNLFKGRQPQVPPPPPPIPVPDTCVSTSGFDAHAALEEEWHPHESL